MFMQVNSKCAHQVRPPPIRIQRSLVVRQTLGDFPGAMSALVVGETENGKYWTARSVTQCGRLLSLREARSACFLIVTPSC